MWAAGCVFAEMLTGSPLFPKDNGKSFFLYTLLIRLILYQSIRLIMRFICAYRKWANACHFTFYRYSRIARAWSHPMWRGRAIVCSLASNRSSPVDIKRGVVGPIQMRNFLRSPSVASRMMNEHQRVSVPPGAPAFEARMLCLKHVLPRIGKMG
jgi:hypothetical protein